EPAFSARRPVAVPRLRSNWLAWQVTLFMGTQGAIAYCIFGWLPLILIDRGLSSLDAGFVLATLMSIQLTTSIIGPWIATRGRDRRPAIFVFIAPAGPGFLWLVYGAASAGDMWAGVFELGVGGVFAFA